MSYTLPETLPPLDALVAAIAAAEHGSFSAAADCLGVTHAAISRRVAVAEQWVGLRLFERHGRGVRPTAEGQRLLSRLAQAISALDQVAIRQKRSVRPRSVRLSTTISFARHWLIPHLAEVEACVPNVQVDFDADPRPVDLRMGHVELAIRYGRGGWKAGAETKLFADRLVPVAIDSLAQGRLPPKQIMALPHLHVGDAVNWRTWAMAKGQSHTLKASDRIMPDYSTALDAAREGVGVALANEALGVIPDGLTNLNTNSVLGPYSYYLLTAPTASEDARAIAAAIRSICGRQG